MWSHAAGEAGMTSFYMTSFYSAQMLREFGAGEELPPCLRVFVLA